MKKELKEEIEESQNLSRSQRRKKENYLQKIPIYSIGVNGNIYEYKEN